MSFTKSSIPIAQTGQFSKLFLAYLDGAPSVDELYSYSSNLEGFENNIKSRASLGVNRCLLVESLRKQYQNASMDVPFTTIELLADKNTFTVCTGHQLCLFTGPLYFIYKILSTINLAEVLKKRYPSFQFVPVYWMASEDHDFEEIRSIHLFGKTLSWENANAKGAVGRISTATLQPLLDQFAEILGTSDNAKEWISMFRDAYTQHANLADATRYFVHTLLGKYGLLVVDGDDKSLKASFSGMIKEDIFEQSNYKLVNETIHVLEEKEMKVQVSPREINCFYLTENSRERIEFDVESAVYKVLNTSIEFTRERIGLEVDEHPERFSPNVVLRPLYQQFILPNVAYVGGPGELAYWLEYRRMFEYHQIHYPALIPRNFALLMDEKHVRQLAKMGLEVIDLFEGIETLINLYVNKVVDSSLLLDQEEEDITGTFRRVTEKVAEVDITLKASVEAELQKVLKSLKMLEGKIMRAEKQKQEAAIQQLRKMKDKYFPQGQLQERYENIAPFYLKHGTLFIEQLKELMQPFDTNLLVIEN